MKASHQPDEQTVMDRAEEIGRMEVEIHQNRLRAILALREILTPEQRQELMRIREESREESRREEGRSRGDPGRAGAP
jgi:Spy/CpxP family protein refolding chaperone